MDAPATTDIHAMADPEVTIGDVTYKIRFRAGDVRRLKDEFQIDLFSPPKVLQGIEAMDHVLKCFRHGVAHQHNIKIQDIEDLIDLGQIQEINAAIQLAQVKAWAQASGKVGPVMELMKTYVETIRANMPSAEVKPIVLNPESAEKPN